MTESQSDVVIITVQYRNFADTMTFAASLAALDDSDQCELVIVDNDNTVAGGSQLTSMALTTPFPVRVVRPDRNLYYWGGAAHALEEIGHPTLRPRWTIVCNNDIQFIDHAFFTRLRSFDADRCPIIAPTIISEATGRDQNPFLAVPPGRLKRMKWRVYDSHYRIAHGMLGAHRLLKRVSAPFAGSPIPQPGDSTARRIYAPHGSFVIFSQSFFQAGGFLDTTVPMFAEEFTIATLAERLSLPIMYHPELKVSHREHSTTGAALTRAKYDMERMARRQHYNRPD